MEEIRRHQDTDTAEVRTQHIVVEHQSFVDENHIIGLHGMVDGIHRILCLPFQTQTENDATGTSWLIGKRQLGQLINQHQVVIEEAPFIGCPHIVNGQLSNVHHLLLF